MEGIRKAVRLASPVTGKQILEAVRKVANNCGFLPINRDAVLEDNCHGFVQSYVIGFEPVPVDPALWLVIGHGPIADRNLFLEKSYSTLFVTTCKNLVYKPEDKVFEQRLATGQEAIMGYLSILAGELEKFFLPASAS